jgi:hypothetical protein
MKSITIFTAAILPFTTNADGACPTINQPVLCISSEGRHVFSNLCFAEAAGFESADCKLEPIDSACPTINEPVFCTSTPESKDRHEFSNICFALEAGHDSENCGPNFSVDPVEPDLRVDPIHPDFSVNPIDPDFSVDPIDPDFSVDPKLINLVCDTIYKPVVCTATPNSYDYNKFSNLCEAEKAGFDSNNCILKTGGLRGQKPTM